MDGLLAHEASRVGHQADGATGLLLAAKGKIGFGPAEGSGDAAFAHTFINVLR